MSQRGGAFLLTWTTYGTWLPGHERGFVSAVRADGGGFVVHNELETPRDGSMPESTRAARARMKGERVVLTRQHARAAVESFREAADSHELAVEIGAVMGTHAHLVVRSGFAEGARLLQLFKGVSSRRLTQRFGKPSGRWWTRHGSRRLLTSRGSYLGAIEYVRAQEDPLVLFQHLRAHEREARARRVDAGDIGEGFDACG